MRLDHKKIREIICSQFDLGYYIKGKFTYFYKKEDGYELEMGYIEQIPAGKYLKTLLVRFFGELTIEKLYEIEERIEELYAEQRKGKPVERCLDRTQKQIIF